MSQLLINDYLKQLDLIKKVSGSSRETIVREAFKDLLKAWGKQQGLVFLAEYPVKTATKSNIIVDGALLHELRMPLGYWEAKDESDDIEEEIGKKLKKGYPQDNIIFSDDVTAVLWQNRYEVLRCDMTDTHALGRLLKLFFSFERPEIAGFRAAVEQFKTDLPAVLNALRLMIELENKSNTRFRKAEQKFLLHAQEAINPSLNEADVREMLIQHILTEEIFAKVFDDSDFHQHNNVARELYARTDKKITKEAIFHYCYAVLHDPLYREKYALNLKREFPRIPFYTDFWQWAAWGEALMKLHIGYESVEPFKLKRTDIPDEKARAAQSPPPQASPGGRGGKGEKQSSILAPKALLRADKDAGSITLDSETTLHGIPPAAWDYKLGNRCALEWVLDQHKEKKPKDPTIREKFDTYRFSDYKEKVIDLLARVTTVSVETERITQAMKQAAR